MRRFKLARQTSKVNEKTAQVSETMTQDISNSKSRVLEVKRGGTEDTFRHLLSSHAGIRGEGTKVMPIVSRACV